MTRAPPNHHRRHSTERTSPLHSSPLLLRGDIRASVPGYMHSRCNIARAILHPEYMTRSTRINWHYGASDVVSVATVTRSLPSFAAATSRRLSWRLSLAPRLFFNTSIAHIMHRGAIALAISSQREKRKRLIARNVGCVFLFG